MFLFTQKFWSYAFERMVKTVAQSAVAVITGEAFGLFNGDAWLNVASISGMAGIVSILMSLTAYSAVNNDADMKTLESTVKRITYKAEVVEGAAEAIKASPINVVPVTEVTTSEASPDAKG